ncbi:MAG TPA: hypothetical protein VFQ53_06570 [Kofleriaceae bacterium]|nr:hypothetical protein [Kofleriaceae bacterium]
MSKSFLLALAAALAVPGVAAAHTDPEVSRRDRLLEVSADPRDGADVVDLSGHARYTALELRAREATVRLRGVDVRFADGRVMHHPEYKVLAPGESHTIVLPPSAGRVVSLVIDYGDRDDRWSDRTAARLEVFGLTTGGDDDCDDGGRYRRNDGWRSSDGWGDRRFEDRRFDDRRYDDRRFDDRRYDDRRWRR